MYSNAGSHFVHFPLCRANSMKIMVVEGEQEREKKKYSHFSTLVVNDAFIKRKAELDKQF